MNIKYEDPFDISYGRFVLIDSNYDVDQIIEDANDRIPFKWKYNKITFTE